MKWITILLALALAYLAATPYITLYQIRNAAKANDGEALTHYIEFPTLRQNLKNQLSKSIAQGTAEATGFDSLGALGAAIGGLFLDKAVDTLVTPAALIGVMNGTTPEQQKETRQKSEPESTTEKTDNFGSSRLSRNDVSTSYESWDRFSVDIPDDDGSLTQVKLQRRGFAWKVTNIVLPLGT